MAEGKLHGRRVLVVEDEYHLANDLGGALRMAGADVLGPVPTVEAALDLLQHEAAPDFAVLDMNLGGDMAYPVADELADRGIPFLFTTGYERAFLPARHASVAWMGKPVDETVVVRALEQRFGTAS
jgi:CheY-like chemotaxis protein